MLSWSFLSCALTCPGYVPPGWLPCASEMVRLLLPGLNLRMPVWQRSLLRVHSVQSLLETGLRQAA